jgi:hypothetical protein
MCMGQVTDDTNAEIVRRTDGGTTLVEVLIAILITGTLVLAVIAAMRVVIETSSFSDEQAGVEAVLGGAADQLGGVTLIPCPDLSGPNSYEQFAQSGAASVGWPTSTTQIEQIKFWDPDTTAWADTNGVGSDDCDSKVFLSTAKAMQRVRVRVTSPDTTVTRTIDVVITDLRNPKD